MRTKARLLRPRGLDEPDERRVGAGGGGRASCAARRTRRRWRRRCAPARRRAAPPAAARRSASTRRAAPWRSTTRRRPGRSRRCRPRRCRRPRSRRRRSRRSVCPTRRRASCRHPLHQRRQLAAGPTVGRCLERVAAREHDGDDGGGEVLAERERAGDGDQRDPVHADVAVGERPRHGPLNGTRIRALEAASTASPAAAAPARVRVTPVASPATAATPIDGAHEAGRGSRSRWVTGRA